MFWDQNNDKNTASFVYTVLEKGRRHCLDGEGSVSWLFPTRYKNGLTHSSSLSCFFSNKYQWDLGFFCVALSAPRRFIYSIKCHMILCFFKIIYWPISAPSNGQFFQENLLFLIATLFAHPNSYKLSGQKPNKYVFFFFFICVCKLCLDEFGCGNKDFNILVCVNQTAYSIGLHQHMRLRFFLEIYMLSDDHCWWYFVDADGGGDGDDLASLLLTGMGTILTALWLLVSNSSSSCTQM